MKIKSSKNKEKISNIAPGTVFKNDGNEVFIKITYIDTNYGRINAVRLNAGVLCLISDDELVEVYPDAELTL